MLYEVTVFGTVWFWVLIALVSLCIIPGVNKEKGGGPTAVFLLGVVVLFLFTDLWQIVKVNPWTSVGVIVGYPIIGALWVIPKWISFLKRLGRIYNTVKEKWLKMKGKEKLSTKALRAEWEDAVSENWELSRYDLRYNAAESRLMPPLFESHRDRIYTWAAFWPWDMLWWVIRRPTRFVFELAVNGFSRMYNQIAERLFADYRD